MEAGCTFDFADGDRATSCYLTVQARPGRLSIAAGFQKNADEAWRITLGTHHDGIMICAVYNRREDAVAKVAEASKLARENGHPLLLRCASGEVVLEPMVSRWKMTILKWLKDMDKRVWKAFWQGA